MNIVLTIIRRKTFTLCDKLFRPEYIIQRRVKRMMRWKRRSRLMAHFVSWGIARRFGCYIAPSAVIGEGVKFPHAVGIVVGEGAVIGDGCVIFQHVTLGRVSSADASYPVLGSGSTVYAGATVLGATSLPPRSVVGAGAIVIGFRGEREGTVLVGAPAAPITRVSAD